MKNNNPWQLGYHIQAPNGWMNDPNGLCFHNGRYHAFYQHHPDSAQWGPMHWGHVSSTDLVHWEHHPIALTPGDEGMCFSGSAVSVGDKLALIYTAHSWLKEDHNDDFMVQKQCLALSDDGIHFEKQGVIIEAAHHESVVHFRDPKVWQEDDLWHMVVGVKEGDDGKVTYYQSDDLKKWQFINTLSTADNDRDEGYMWECPDFFKLNESHILLCSPQGMSARGFERRNLFQNGYFVGKFDKRTGMMSRSDFTELDYGHDFYACQTFEDDKGRRIAISWMDMWESAMPEQQFGRAGALSLPRELTLDSNGHIYQRPVDELKLLRREKLLAKSSLILESGKTPLDVKGKQLEIELTLALPSKPTTTNKEKKAAFERSGILVRTGAGEQTYIGYDAMQRRIFLDRNQSGEGVTGIRYTPPLPCEQDQTLTLHIFVDSSSVEVFVNDGLYTLTSRIYPTDESQGVEYLSENGSSTITDLAIYQLASPML